MPELQLSTFSITARDRATGMFGVAVSTAVPAVGALCPFAKPGIGAIASQAFVNFYLGSDGMRLLEDGLTAEAALEKLIADDPGRDVRQLAIVDGGGQAAAYTGPGCTSWAGHLIGDGVAVAGNMLVGEETIAAMLASFEESEGEDFVERLMAALEAGQAAGGDFRGRQSAALRVAHEEEFPYCDLRVDEHTEPVAELRRVLEVAKIQLFPFLHGLPNRRDPLGQSATEIRQLLRLPPAERGGPTLDAARHDA